MYYCGQPYLAVVYVFKDLLLYSIGIFPPFSYTLYMASLVWVPLKVTPEIQAFLKIASL